ncbi:uncharacterized protein LOC124157344 [Ischnura elegans]|uniref:uncharacterized protein LOC124157344 n=1 Tax=Ischnura elegans TaxID=197161 RepID=UPI001ED879A8|nr:uncharacterized protein LOC124157344 [Ischnura elegans]
MAKLQLSLVAAMLLVAGAHAAIKDKCPFAIGKYPFDPEKMVGKWYVITCASNHPDQETKYCPKYEVTYQKTSGDEKFEVKFTALDKNRKELSYEGVSKPWQNEKVSMLFGVMKKSDAEKYDGVYMESIIATDYDNYAVYLGCKPTFDAAKNDFGRQYRAAVLSRKPTLSEDIKKTLVNVLSGYDIKETEFKVMEHTECPE